MERIKTFDELTIRDNFLFQHVMRNERLCKHLIEKFLNIQIRSLQYQSFEKTIDLRLEGKSIRLDVFVEDNEGRVYDIEMQCSNSPRNDLAKRSAPSTLFTEGCPFTLLPIAVKRITGYN